MLAIDYPLGFGQYLAGICSDDLTALRQLPPVHGQPHII
jgi:hypothetical protein